MNYYNMNFYNILGVKENASKDEIKKVYRGLVLKYHPDKSSNPNSTDKFREIHAAYTILYDDIKRKEYDELSNEDKYKMYDMFKDYLVNISPLYADIYNIIIKCYSNKESDLKEDFNNFNFKNIYNKVITSAQFPLKIKNDLNIYGTIYTNIRERYSNKYKIITVNRTQNNNTVSKYVVPVTENEIVINSAGEIDDKGNCGDVIIRVVCEEDEKFKQLNEFDLYIIEKISISQYFYGGYKNIEYLDGNTLNISFSSFIEKVPLICIENKGLPIDSDNTNDNDNINNIRGDLYVYFKVDGINYDENKDVENILIDTFPPIIN